jgi:hypothetical protein
VNFRDLFLAPLRWAGFMLGVMGRITLGIVGFVVMGVGLLLISPLDLAWVGLPLVLVGLLLTVRAIF